MSTLIFDTATVEKLMAAGSPFELRDETGKLLARYIRVDAPPVPPEGYEIEGDWPSREEIERRKREGRWHSTADVIAHLKSL